MEYGNQYKYAVLLLLAAGLLFLASCMNDKVLSPEEGTGSQRRADLVVGVEKAHAPWFRAGKDAKGHGIYADLVRELAEKEDLSYVFLEVDPVSAKPALEAGSIDCYLGTLAPAIGEDLGLWQSDPVFQSPLCLAVLQDSAMDGPAGIRDREVAAGRGTQEEGYALSLAGKYGAQPVTFPSERAALNDVEKKISSAAAADYACIRQKEKIFRVLEISDSIQNIHCFYTLNQNECAGRLADGITYLRDSGKLEEIAASIPTA